MHKINVMEGFSFNCVDRTDIYEDTKSNFNHVEVRVIYLWQF